ncbi:tyrosine-type recombinase/integrase [Nonomuraea diastatica]|uniref:tyrosine-type recombinase/integrase n=1 Tax=Nonomuraea diastatica TaxID=1848329 RepID=UPI001FEB4984|nr:site-specific integrase [Nonomuraea diastatica]
MDRIDTVKVPKTLPRPAAAADVAKVLTMICSRWPRKDLPLDRLRDRVLFETAYVCGARASEVCSLHMEDLDLRLDDEHVRIHGKGGSIRTVLLDDRGYVALLKLYLARAGYTAGPLFRASINGRGGPLSNAAAHHRWQSYCAQAGVEIDIHQLRHAHATELINAGVSIEAMRRRLGNASTETTQLYALLDDKIADAEIRAARRRRDQTGRAEPEPLQRGLRKAPPPLGPVRTRPARRPPAPPGPRWWPGHAPPRSFTTASSNLLVFAIHARRTTRTIDLQNPRNLINLERSRDPRSKLRSCGYSDPPNRSTNSGVISQHRGRAGAREARTDHLPPCHRSHQLVVSGPLSLSRREM